MITFGNYLWVSEIPDKDMVSLKMNPGNVMWKIIQWIMWI